MTGLEIRVLCLCIHLCWVIRIYLAKMGRTVIADEKLVQDLSELSKYGGFIPGLILGQSAVPGLKDYVVHLPVTPVPEGSINGESSGDEVSGGNSFKKLNDIDDSAIGEHARAVTRMLSGGMWVLGFYVVGPGDLFSDKNALAKLRSIANKIHTCTKGNEFMNGKDPSNQKLVLHFCSLSKKFTCKTIQMDNLNSSISPADWKFKSHTTSWLQVQSVLDFDSLPPFFVNKNAVTKKKFQECLTTFKHHLESLLYNINGKFCEADQFLSSLEKPVHEASCEDDEDEHQCQYNLMFFEYMDPPKDDEKAKDALVLEEYCELKFDGSVVSRVFLHEKSTAEDAVKAVRDDFVRSLASRLEMHWQTVEEPQIMNKNTKYFLRSPPRRVLFIPEGLDIAFSEYVFEGETEDEALSSIIENLGFPDCQIIVLENDADLANISDSDEESISESSSKGENPLSLKPKNQQSNSLIVYGITASFLILILSVFIHLFINS